MASWERASSLSVRVSKMAKLPGRQGRSGHKDVGGVRRCVGAWGWAEFPVIISQGNKDCHTPARGLSRPERWGWHLQEGRGLVGCSG